MSSFTIWRKFFFLFEKVLMFLFMVKGNETFWEETLHQSQMMPFAFINDIISPVPELSFLPAAYRGWTRAGERRVQDNLHAHAQNAAIFSPQIGGKTIFGSIFQIWLVARFSEWYIQATIYVFRLIKNMSINPKSVEFHLYHAKPHSICFLSQYQR